MKPKISVIIPCYNSEKYLMRCADSLTKQTIGIENLELIFVNDASQDNTLNMLAYLENKFPNNIIIINLPENKKQGTARNIGIQYATADYIGFVDSDDWIDVDMYRKLYSKVEQYNCDVVGCDLKMKQPSSEELGELTNEDANFDLKEDDLYLTIHSIEDRKVFFDLEILGGFFTNIYRKSLIVDNEIYFPEQITYEDNYWLGMLRLEINSIYKINKKMYYYCLNPGSTIQSINATHHLDRLTIELMKLEDYKRKGVFDIYRDEIEIEFLKLFYINTLHIFFTKFTTVPVNIVEFMKKKVFFNFPNYKENYYFVNSIINFDPILTTLDLTWDESQWNVFAEDYRKIFNFT